jgi:hypothetical protein
MPDVLPMAWPEIAKHLPLNQFPSNNEEYYDGHL